MAIDSEVSLNGEKCGNKGNVDNGGNIDPLFIASSNNPTSSLVIAVFSGGNFMRWSRNVPRALIVKNKEGFISELLLMLDEKDKDFQKWKHVDYMAMCWILSSMSHELADEFEFKEYSMAFSEQVYQLVCSFNMNCVDEANLNLFSNIRHISFEMFSLHMKFGVLSYMFYR